MNGKPVLMIHEVREWMFKLPLDQYVLTFDDGLFSQYYYLDKFLSVDTEKIFFISTNIICPEDVLQSEEFPDCRLAHEQFFSQGIRKHYMKWSQIKEISASPKCSIGGHSHQHVRRVDQKLGQLYVEMTNDTDMMFKEFERQNIAIKSFCFPYNHEHLLYREVLKKKGIEHFYGDERVAIESLQEMAK